MPDLLTRVDQDGATMEFDAEGAHRYHTEHQRLKDAVVDAVVVMRRLETEMWNCATDEHNERQSKFENALEAFNVATDALLAFEAEHKIGE